jgi:hypothetical protein
MPGRRAKRFKVRSAIPITFLGSDVRLTGGLLDISTGGLLARCDQDIQVGRAVRMAMPVDSEISRFVGVARRSLPGVGVAFEFSQMTPRDRDLLRRLLLRLANSSHA